MGAFGIGANTRKTDEKIHGKKIDIACDCWFTSQGKTIPRMIKFMNENGEIQTVTKIHIKYAEQKNYVGIPSVEYLCSIAVGNINYEVKLIFIQEKCKWIMNFL